MTPIVPLSDRNSAIRRAVFDLVLQGGVEAITQQAVADEIGMSLSSVRRWMTVDELPPSGLEWIERRQRRRRFESVPGELVADSVKARVFNTLLRELPFDSERRDEEIVWLRLVTAFAGKAWADDGREARHTYLQRIAVTLTDDLPGEAVRDEQLRLISLVYGVTAAAREGVLEPADSLRLVRDHVLRLNTGLRDLQKTS